MIMLGHVGLWHRKYPIVILNWNGSWWWSYIVLPQPPQ